MFDLGLAHLLLDIVVAVKTQLALRFDQQLLVVGLVRSVAGGTFPIFDWLMFHLGSLRGMDHGTGQTLGRPSPANSCWWPDADCDRRCIRRSPTGWCLTLARGEVVLMTLKQTFARLSLPSSARSESRGTRCMPLGVGRMDVQAFGRSTWAVGAGVALVGWRRSRRLAPGGALVAAPGTGTPSKKKVSHFCLVGPVHPARTSNPANKPARPYLSAMGRAAGGLELCALL